MSQLNKKYTYILGVPNFASYEPATALLRVPQEGSIDYVCIPEERLNRKKHSYTFPLYGVDYCLNAFGLESLREVDYIYTDYAREARWINSGPGYRKLDHDYIKLKLDFPRNKIRLVNHHDAHAASAFYPSDFDEAAVLIIDGLGSNLETQSLYKASRKDGLQLVERGFDWGIGRLYSLITGAVLPYGPEKGYGKTMGLAPYGAAHPGPVLKFNAHDEGMSSDYSEFFSRYPISRLVAEDVQRCIDREDALLPYFARAAYDLQLECERQLLRMADYAYKKIGSKNLCLAGGVILNGAANSRILEKLPYERLFCQPACSDMGVPFGAALWGYFNELADKKKNSVTVSMPHAYTGINYSQDYIKKLLDEYKIQATSSNPEEVAKLLSEGKVVAWFEGGSEYGPRALGHRSILSDPRKAETKDKLNSKVKFREGYRPYAPSILAEHAYDWLELKDTSPFMLQVVPVKKDKRQIVGAITHVDGTTRPQTVTKEANPNYHKMISAFYQLTGVPLVLNTSFNINREPIVETPEDALICSIGTAIDYLYLNGMLVDCGKYNQSSLVKQLVEKRTEKLDRQWQNILKKYCPLYDEKERDTFLTKENLIADWHRDFRAKTRLDEAVDNWLKNNHKILIIGTAAHTSCLYSYITNFPELNIIGYVELENKTGEKDQCPFYNKSNINSVDWTKVDSVLISTHEYQRFAVELAKKHSGNKQIFTLYDDSSDSLIYTLPGVWPMMNPDYTTKYQIKNQSTTSITASNIDFDFAPSETTILDRYGLALTYHWINADKDLFKGMHAIDPKSFEAQVRSLRQHFTLVTPTELINPKIDLPETVCLITIDDGLKGTFDHMYPILKQWQEKAVVYCCSLPLREKKVLNVHKIHMLQERWGLEKFRKSFYELLPSSFAGHNSREALTSTGINQDKLYPYDTPETREFKILLNYLLPYNQLTDILDKLFDKEFGSQKSAVDQIYMSLDDIKKCQDAGWDIGIHTDSHPVLSRLTNIEQEQEIKIPTDFFKSKLHLDKLHFCYPYGSSGTWNNYTKRLLKDNNFDSSFTLQRNIIKPKDISMRWEMPRYSCSDLFDKTNNLNTKVISALSGSD
ncbi:MAG: polysaccharide deacetylase family protein [Alphaproteobacteria bacterium]|nr:polysaccharide deacetylase family protein [Alphaproteobacteria bacterium]